MLRVAVARRAAPFAARQAMFALVWLHYERHLAEDLQELRARWRVLTAPHPQGQAAGGGGGQ
jgi:hypothetical protein